MADSIPPAALPPGLVAIIVMGVSGSGKTTIGVPLAERLACEFQEGDDLHPPANIAKMANGDALTDADRLPWLQRIAEFIAAWRARGRCGVITSSALKRAYRDRIIARNRDVVLVYLHGSFALLQQRMRARRGHFMPASLLQSQLDTLEAPEVDECAIWVDVDQTPEAIIAEIICRLRDWPDCMHTTAKAGGQS